MQTLRSNQSLLAAALHNFHESETVPALHRHAYLRDGSGRLLPLSFERFALLCRTLDIGGQYQQLIRARLFPKSRPPAPADFAQAAVHHLFEERQRSDLEVAVRAARIKGRLDERAYLHLLPLFARQPIVPVGAGTVRARQLYILGKCMEGAVVLELRSAVDETLEGLICWLPGDPVGEITQHGYWKALYDDLGMRLRKPDYVRYWARFVTERDRPGFTAQLQRLRTSIDPHTPLALDARHFAIDEPLFGYLRRRQVQKLLDDARILAVPTADQTILERHERLEALENAGLEVINLAALFIPALGATMALVTAVGIVRDIYEGFSAWRLGDRQSAIDHVINVGQTFALGALQGIGQAGAGLAIERFPFVDALHPVHLGRHRFRLSQLPESAHFMERVSDLFSRLDDELGEVDEPDAQVLLRITGLTPQAIRHMHVDGQRAPARLRDACARYRLHVLEPLLPVAAVELTLAQQAGSPSPEAALLMRSFTGLSVAAADEVLSHANTEQLAALTTGRVPLAVAEHARWAVRESRLDRALMGLQHNSAVNEDTLRLTLALLDDIAPWPETLRVEMREGELEGRLLAARGNANSQPGWVIVRHHQGYHLDGAGPQPLDQGLMQCLWLTLGDQQKAVLGGTKATAADLSDGLLRHAAEDRARAGQAMGLIALGGRFNPPHRLHDGRLGYPLSGRGESSRQAIRRGIRTVYPTLSDGQLEGYIERVIREGGSLWDHLGELQLRLDSLRHALQAWEHERTGLLDGRRRRHVATQIRRAWRRKTGDAQSGTYVLHVEDERVGGLPSLPAEIDFSHIHRLTLRNLGLDQIRAEFLLRFSQLRELDLRDNQLTRLPVGLELLTELRVLRLGGNRIVLGAQGSATVGRLSKLQVLDLSANPLSMMPDLSGMRHLREVHMRGCGLEDLAGGERLPVQGLVDFRENQIREVSAQLQTLGERLQQIYLHDNPLDEVSRRLLEQSSGLEHAAGRGSPGRLIVDEELFDNWLGDATAHVRNRRRELWGALAEESQSADLFRFLADFAESDDFDERAPYYRARVWRILELCGENTDVREAVFLQVQGPHTCDDRLLLLLSQLELQVHIALHTAGLGTAQTEAALVQLGRSLYRLDQVDQIAAAHIQRMRRYPYAMVDDIEVYLAYRVNLAQRLGLPLQPAYMNFPEFSGVSSRQISLAGDRILASETQEALSTALAQRDFWQAFVRTRYQERFEALAAPLHERLEASEALAQQGDEQAYLVHAATLMNELNAQEQALYLTLAKLAYGMN